MLSLPIGQCGNQINESFFHRLSLETKDDLNPWFTFNDNNNNNKKIARSILIDMEPKVIQQNMLNAKNFNFQYAASYWKHSGSANNWSYGYHIHGHEIENLLHSMIQKELEKINHFKAFLCIHSLAGGTGSGLGSLITQLLSFNYPKYNIYNQVIFPHLSGDVSVQAYNTILTLSHLFQFSDGIILHKNDDLNYICQKRLHLKSPSFKDMNQIVAQRLVSCIGLPVQAVPLPLLKIKIFVVTHNYAKG